MNYKDKVKLIVVDTINDLFQVRCMSDKYDENFFGDYFRFKSYDVLYLFFEIEKRLGVNIDTNKLDFTDFTTVNNVVELVSK